MEATNPTMGGAPPIVDGPVGPDIDECLRRLKALIDARANEGPTVQRWKPEEVVWQTDGLSMPWIEEVSPCDTGPLA